MLYKFLIDWKGICICTAKSHKRIFIVIKKQFYILATGPNICTTLRVLSSSTGWDSLLISVEEKCPIKDDTWYNQGHGKWYDLGGHIRSNLLQQLTRPKIYRVIILHTMFLLFFSSHSLSLFLFLIVYGLFLTIVPCSIVLYLLFIVYSPIVHCSSYYCFL